MNAETHWLTVREAAERARCGSKTMYRAVRSGQLRAARVGGRRELRFLAVWIDQWLIGTATGKAAGNGGVADAAELEVR